MVPGAVSRSGTRGDDVQDRVQHTRQATAAAIREIISNSTHLTVRTAGARGPAERHSCRDLRFTGDNDVGILPKATARSMWGSGRGVEPLQDCRILRAADKRV